MRVGVALEETWDFFNEIYSELTNTFETSLFKRRTFHLPIFNARINRVLFKYDLQQFMQKNDVVFFEFASELLIAATHLEKTCGIVTRLHRYEMYQWVDKIYWERVDRIILVSKAMQEEFIEKFPSQASKTVVSCAAVSLEKFSLKPKTFEGNIGILCHIAPRKRVYELVLAFSTLCQSQPGLKLHIAGDYKNSQVDYFNAIHYLVKQLGLQNQVVFDGFLPDPSGWYSQMDIFISNSYSEGLQVALMEAMASGCYCLSHHWKGADEMLPEENLYFRDEQMLEKISAYIALPDAERLTVRAKMREIACDRFDIEKTKKTVINVIKSVGAPGASHG